MTVANTGMTEQGRLVSGAVDGGLAGALASVPAGPSSVIGNRHLTPLEQLAATAFSLKSWTNRAGRVLAQEMRDEDVAAQEDSVADESDNYDWRD